MSFTLEAVTAKVKLAARQMWMDYQPLETIPSRLASLAWLNFTPLHFVPPRFVSLRFASRRFASLRFAKLRFASLLFATVRLTSLRLDSLRITWLSFALLLHGKSITH